MPPSPPPSDVGSLYHLHHGWVRNLFRHKLGNAHDAAELAHDVFLRLLSKPRTFASDADAKAFLGAMSRNMCVDFWRRRRVEQAWLEVMAERPEAFQPSEEHRALMLETLLQVQAMLERLPATVAEAFILAQVHGLGYRAIAEQLGVSERTVTSYMAKAMFHCAVLEAELAGLKVL
ncbi:sigma-70 family RNA polymerase sigma factor [Pseudomonas monteilii]|uniref:sigma-70 family RNA polymerase sigma factor n=1 Tax=Pseudomonas monteilii TaxID=76759 RepID=UPI00383081D3